jgi:hypothetical protein
MQGRIIFLLEEPSMKALLNGLLPRLLPGLRAEQHFLCVPHEGKSDLDRSIPRKLTAWREPAARFVIVRDNDNANCTEIKNHIRNQCNQAGRSDVLIRLVCQELESWYLGDLSALARAYPRAKIDTPALRKRYQSPDGWQKPSAELKRHLPEFQKILCARLIAQQLNLEQSHSHSFRVFVEGVKRLAHEMGYIELIPMNK